MDAKTLVREAVVARAPALGLRAADVRVAYVLNHGGFVNRSYHVTDGVRRLHLKLADDPAQIAQLRQWQSEHRLLERDYRAPAMLDWLAVPAAALEGPVFAHVEGAAPARVDAAALAALAPTLARLHADRELADRLGGGGPSVRAIDVLERTYHRRASEDLAGLEAERPPFVTDSLLGWMHAEVAALLAEARAMSEFQVAVASPTHGDLWIENLRVGADGRWWVLDWDDLAVGDPALDWAMLLGPTRTEPRAASVDELPAAAVLDEAGRVRLRVYARAALLDWVIDPLADWIAAAEEPAHRDAVRRDTRRIHEAARDAYRARFGMRRG